MPIDTRLAALRAKMSGYGKENQGELLYGLAEGARLLSGSEQIRIYLEDLTRGALSCAHATGPRAGELRETGFPIGSTDTVVSSVFVSQYPVDFRTTSERHDSSDEEFARRFGFLASYVMPLVSLGKSIGVLCVDRDLPGKVLTAQEKSQLADFTGSVADRVDQARIYHQQVRLARRLEEFKAREAAGMMVRSAVKLVDKVCLASVLVPVVGDDSGSGSLRILASYSEDPDLKALYDQQGAINLQKGKSLLSQYVSDEAVISDERLLKPLFIADLTRHHLQQRALTESMALRSLYVVPRYAPDSRRIICLVNYFSREMYRFRFSDFEMGLLQTHAEMVERVISEVGGNTWRSGSCPRSPTC